MIDVESRLSFLLFAIIDALVLSPRLPSSLTYAFCKTRALSSAQRGLKLSLFGD